MRQQLGAHLSVLIREGAISLWSDRVIRPGEEIDLEIRENLESADIVLLLMSSEFLASNYCYEIEGRRALELHEQGKAHVVPVILRDCDWRRTPFGKLMAVPTDGRPVKSWPDRDKAYRIVVDRLRTLIGADADSPSPPVQPQERRSDPLETSTPTLELVRLGERGGRARRDDIGKAAAAAPTGFLGQLGQLIEIVDDLGRRSTDMKHASRGGKINYVFDVNIFQLFVAPRNFAGTVSLFHSSCWSPTGDSDSWRSTNHQSALLAGEYLFSGSLPGQHEGNVYLTGWHHHELLQQVDYLVRDVGDRARDIDIARDFLFRMARFRADMARGSHRSDATVAGHDPRVFDDIETLREAGVPENQLTTYLSTRMALEALAAGEPIASLCQLQRMLSPKFFESIHPAEELAHPDRHDRRAIADEANEWSARLRDEAEIRGTRAYPRDQLSILHDAQSLALVSWLARRRETEGELTVLVTGDALMFAAYKRWYDRERRDGAFLLRRVAQYAPIFSLGDRDVVESPQSTIINQFVEIGLLPFNISKSEMDPAHERRLRSSFAQQIGDGLWDSDPEYRALLDEFSPGTKSELYRNFIREMQKLSSVWRQIETITLGLNPDLIAYRLASALPDALAFRPDQAAFAECEVEEWMQATLASLHRDVAALWMPIALDAIDRLRHAKPARSSETLPMREQLFSFRVRLDAQQGLQSVKLGRDGDFDGNDGSRLPLKADGDEADLLQHRAIVFGVAAFLAAEHRQTVEATRYGSLCVEAFRIDSGPEGNQENLREAERFVSSIRPLSSGKDPLANSDNPWGSTR